MNNLKKALLIAVLTLSTSVFAQYPNDFTLKELEKEITKKEDCSALVCNTVNNISIKEINLEKRTIKLILAVDARVDSLAILPINTSEVSVHSLSLNQKPWYGAGVSNNGQITVAILKGSNEFELELFVKGQSFNLSGYQKKIVDLSNSKYLRVTNSTIEILKEGGKATTEEVVSKFTTIPFFVVDRTIILDQKWKVRTTVSLLDEIGNSIPRTLTINALPGESVLSENIKNDDGKIIVNITNKPVIFESILEEKPQLIANGSKDYLQKINFINNSNWLFNFSSLEPVSKDTNTRYASSYSWLFWPEDKLVLNINKPIAVKGDAVAVQSINASLNTQKTPNELSYVINLKASLGSKVKLQYPNDLTLKNVLLNNQEIPFKSDNNILIVDVNSGENTINLTMDTKEGLPLVHHYPQLKLEIPSNNYTYNLEMPKQRWVIWTGGANLRASILLWGILIACVLFAYPISKAIKSPLGWIGWSLLLVGLSQSGLWGLFLVVIWFGLIHFKQFGNLDNVKRFNFNAIQVLLVILTIAVASSAISTVAKGLLNYPNLFLEGEGTYINKISWYSQQVDQFSPWLLSLPMWVYRVLMFSWSIWFAFNIMKWLKWAWEGFSRGGVWIASKQVEKVIQEDPSKSVI